MKGSMIMASAQAKIHTEKDYYNLPEDVRAELIDGQIFYMSSPNRVHQEILGYLFEKIANYIDRKKDSGKVYPTPFAVRLFKDSNKTIVEPDICVVCDPDKLTDQGCTGAPDWIIEIISPGNPGNDYICKLNLYAKAGVREYWIVDPRSKKVLVYYLGQTELEVKTYTLQDKIKVNIYNDLWINFKELNLL